MSAKSKPAASKTAKPASKTVAQIEKKEAEPAPAPSAAEKRAKSAKASPGTKKRRANYKSYGSFTGKVLKQVHPDTGINRNATEVINRLVEEFIRSLSMRVNELLMHAKRQTVNTTTLKAAIRVFLPGELAKHAISEGDKAVAKYQNSPAPAKVAGKREGALRSVRSGLIFPIPRTEKKLKNQLNGRKRVSVNAAIFLTASIEYLIAEILELAGNVSRDSKSKRITPRHIRLSLGHDDELNAVVANSGLVLQGGVLPNIHAVLLPAKSKAAKTSA